MSDTHDDTDAVQKAVSFALDEGKENGRIVHAGDLSLRPYLPEHLGKLDGTNVTSIQKFIQSSKDHNEEILKDYKKIFDDSKLPYAVIPGNYDNDLEEIFAGNNLHNKSTNFAGAKVIGYGGAGDNGGEWVGQPHIELLYKLKKIVPFIVKDLESLLIKEKPAIAVIHNPPHRLCDDMHDGRNVGTRVTTRYIAENPGLKLVISGHVHEAGPNGNNPNNVKGVKCYQDADRKIRTAVINPGNLGRFELVNPKNLETAKYQDGKLMRFDYGTFCRVDIEDDGTPILLKQYSLKLNDWKIGDVKKIEEYDLTP